MKKFGVAILAVAMVVMLAASAMASIGAVQVQVQGVTQSQSSFGGFSISGQTYATGQVQSYTLNKGGNVNGTATGTTAINTNAGQLKFGNGFQNQNGVNGSLNGGGLLY